MRGDLSLLDALLRLAPAIPLTVGVAVASGVLGAVVAIVAGAARLSPLRPVRLVAGLYVEVFRGTSAVVQVFWFYFVLPLLGVPLSGVQAGILALALNGGAYGAEVVRGSILAVPRGQVEAAIALNYPPAHRLLRIVLPQAWPLALPQAGNLAVSLLKATSLLSLVGTAEATSRAQTLRDGGEEGVVYLALLLLYLSLSTVAGAVVWLLERRAGRHLTRPPRGGPAYRPVGP